MKVVDLSDTVAGAFCTRLLAGAGYEAVASNDPVAGWRSVSGDRWLAAYLREGVTTVDDRESLRRYLLDADVVVTSHDRDRSWRSDHGIDVGDQVEVSVGDFARGGPYAHYRGSPLIDWASGGHLFITGLPGRPPLAGPRHLPEYVTGYAAAFAAELGAAVLARGCGPVSVSTSTMELLAGMHQYSFSQLAATGTVKVRERHPQPIHPMDIFCCADGWVCLAVVTEGHYDSLAAVVGEPVLVTDERFATPASRHAHSDAFDSAVADWFRTRKADDVVAELQHHRVPALRLAFPEDVFDDPQLAARSFWVPSPIGGRMPGIPFRIREEPSPGAPATTGCQAGGRLPLSGLTVVDITEFWSGPSCSRALADFGATVIRVERPGSRWHRVSAARLQDWKMHRGKLSVAIDLKSPGGSRLVRSLAARADLVVENFRPGVLDRLGLGFDDLLPRATPLVYLSLSGFGRSGPRARWSSFGPLLEAASSIQGRTRYPGGPPLLLGHSLPDPVGGMLGAFLSLAAVRQARHDGCSRHVDVSQLEAYVACCGEELLRASLGAPAGEEAMLSGVFATRGEDEWLAVEAGCVEQVEGLASVLGPLPTHGDLRGELARALARTERFAAAGLLQRHGVPAFPVVSVADLAGDVGLHRSGFMVQVPFEDETATMPGVAFGGVPHRADLPAPAPPCGAHTLPVLRELCCLAEEELESLLARGVISVSHEIVD